MFFFKTHVLLLYEIEQIKTNLDIRMGSTHGTAPFPTQNSEINSQTKSNLNQVETVTVYSILLTKQHPSCLNWHVLTSHQQHQHPSGWCHQELLWGTWNTNPWRSDKGSREFEAGLSDGFGWFSQTFPARSVEGFLYWTQSWNTSWIKH